MVADGSIPCSLTAQVGFARPRRGEAYVLGMRSEPSPSSLSRYVYLQACNSAWSNLRLFRACLLLSDEDFAARRTSFFPSIRATLNHNLAVDSYYLDAMERSLAGEPPNLEFAAFFEPSRKHQTCAPLWEAQRSVDQRLMSFCRQLSDHDLAREVEMPRVSGIVAETTYRLLAHLFEHQIHHRGQAHAMLAGTKVAPPQLDEFFCAGDAKLRASELTELGLSEAELWPSAPGR